MLIKKKKNNYIKANIIGFVMGIVVCGGVSVIAMTYFPSSQTTYDNSVSGMKAQMCREQ